MESEEREVGGRGTRRSLSISRARSGASVRDATAIGMLRFFNCNPLAQLSQSLFYPSPPFLSSFSTLPEDEAKLTPLKHPPTSS